MLRRRTRRLHESAVVKPHREIGGAHRTRVSRHIGPRLALRHLVVGVRHLAKRGVETGALQLNHQHLADILEAAEDINRHFHRLPVFLPHPSTVLQPAAGLHQPRTLLDIVDPHPGLLDQILDSIGKATNRRKGGKGHFCRRTAALPAHFYQLVAIDGKVDCPPDLRIGKGPFEIIETQRDRPPVQIAQIAVTPRPGRYLRIALDHRANIGRTRIDAGIELISQQ